jgi:NAD(P)H-hydrate epimerase
VPVHGAADDIGAPELVIDALLGYSQEGSPRGAAADLIGRAADSATLALDVPSGLELATGAVRHPHVKADATLTLAAPKAGLRSGRDVVGTLFVADISVPATAYERIGVEYETPFASASVVRVVGW